MPSSSFHTVSYQIYIKKTDSFYIIIVIIIIHVLIIIIIIINMIVVDVHVNLCVYEKKLNHG